MTDNQELLKQERVPSKGQGPHAPLDGTRGIAHTTPWGLGQHSCCGNALAPITTLALAHSPTYTSSLLGLSKCNISSKGKSMTINHIVGAHIND
jgi:hypothetical protein